MNNTVELLGYYGSDETHACSAWTSTSRDLTEDKKARIPKLIKMLWDSGHFSPFEKSSLHFLVNTDIATHIHILKHRVGVSVNAESARYKELNDDKLYLPEDWKGVKCDMGDDPAGDYKAYDWYTALENHSKMSDMLYHQCLEELTPVLGRKRAKESARYFKTYNSQIQADVMFNFRSFGLFQKLRNSEHAQKEVMEVAEMMLELVKGIEGNPFEHTLAALGL